MRLAGLLLLASLVAAQEHDAALTALAAADVHVRREAAKALADVPGEAIITALREALIDDDLVVRAAAARSLGAHGATAAAAADDLDSAADDSIDAVRGAALVALAQLGDAGLPNIVKRVRDPATRAATFDALNAQEAEAYPAVLVLLAQPSWHVRDWTLKRVRPAAPVPDAYVAAIARLVADDPSEAVRHAAAVRLCTVESSAAAPHLRQALQSPDPYVRAAGVSGLAHTALDAASVTALAAVTGDAEPAVAVRASLALCAAGDHETAALPALRGALRHADPRSRTAAAAALAALGETTDASIPLLLAAVRTYPVAAPYPDRHRNIRAGGGPDLAVPPDPLPHAVEQVVRLGARAVPLLAPLVSEGEVEERLHVLFALARIGAPARPALREALGSEEAAVRRVAAACLVWTGETGQAELRILAAAFTESDPGTPLSPEAAADLLEKAGAAAVPALLDHARAEFRRANPGGPVVTAQSTMVVIPEAFQGVLELCIRIGGPAVPALEATRGDPAVGGLAAEALRQIAAEKAPR